MSSEREAQCIAIQRGRREPKRRVVFSFEVDDTYANEDDIDYFIPEKDLQVVNNTVKITYKSQQLEAKILKIGGTETELDDFIDEWKEKLAADQKEEERKQLLSNEEGPGTSTGPTTSGKGKPLPKKQLVSAAKANGIASLNDLHSKQSTLAATATAKPHQKAPQASVRQNPVADSAQNQGFVAQATATVNAAVAIATPAAAIAVQTSGQRADDVNPNMLPLGEQQEIYQSIPRYLPTSTMTLARTDPKYECPDDVARFLLSEYYPDTQRKAFSALGSRNGKKPADKLVMAAIKLFALARFPGQVFKTKGHVITIFNKLNGDVTRKLGYRSGKYPKQQRRKPGEEKKKPGPKPKKRPLEDREEEHMRPPPTASVGINEAVDPGNQNISPVGLAATSNTSYGSQKPMGWDASTCQMSSGSNMQSAAQRYANNGSIQPLQPMGPTPYYVQPNTSTSHAYSAQNFPQTNVNAVNQGVPPNSVNPMINYPQQGQMQHQASYSNYGKSAVPLGFNAPNSMHWVPMSGMYKDPPLSLDKTNNMH